MRQPENIANRPVMPESPDIVIGVPAQQQWKKPEQKYDRLITKYQFKEPSMVTFFNSILRDENPYHIYGFLKPGFIFAHENVIKKIIAAFCDNPEIVAVYSDYSVNEKEFYLDPWDTRLNPLDTSIFINGAVRQKIIFAEGDDTFSKMFLTLMQTGMMVVHMPEKLLYKYA